MAGGLWRDAMAAAALALLAVLALHGAASACAARTGGSVDMVLGMAEGLNVADVMPFVRTLKASPPPAEAPETGLSIYAAWSRDELRQFSDRHAELSLKERKGTLDKSALRGHVLQIPSQIREARLKIAESAASACDQIDEILCEAAAYHASCAARC